MGMVEKKDVFLQYLKVEIQEKWNILILFKKNGNILLGMSAKSKSFLGEQSDHLLYTPLVKEACLNNLAPNTSTTVQVLKREALAISLMQLNGSITRFYSDSFLKKFGKKVF